MMTRNQVIETAKRRARRRQALIYIVHDVDGWDTATEEELHTWFRGAEPLGWADKDGEYCLPYA